MNSNDILSERTIPIGGGYVQLIDVFGDDYAVIQAARISYAASETENPSQFIEKLVRNGHGSPFEMVEMKFRVRVPMDTWRQWVRHRTANVNEVSTRYTGVDTDMALEDLCNVPHIPKEIDSDLDLWIEQTLQSCFNLYRAMVESGVSKQVARSVLPLCTYTTAYWKIDVRNLMNFLRLRLSSHAQGSPGGIRDYAKAVDSLFEIAFPLCHKAFHTIEKENEIK